MKNRWQDLREMLKMNMSWLVQIARKSYLSSARLLPLCRIHFLCASAHFFLFTIVFIIVIVTTDANIDIIIVIIIVITTDVTTNIIIFIIFVIITITIPAIIVISKDSLQSLTFSG